MNQNEELQAFPVTVGMSELHRRISQFHLQSQVHQGIKCDIYDADYAEGAERAAIKILKPQFACVGEELRLFLQEVSWARQVQDPIFPHVIEAGESGGIYFLAMKFVDGWQLGEFLRLLEEQGIPLPYYVALIIVNQIANGVQTLHECQDSVTGSKLGLVHQGITPENILLHKTGSVSLLDFGETTSLESRLNPPMMLVDSSDVYIAPELGKGYLGSVQSDVFSLGQVLAALLALVDPSGQQLDGNELVARACHPVADARFASMADMSDAIEQLAQHRGFALSKEICANFVAMVAGSQVMRSEPGAHSSKKQSFFSMSSEGMKTVMAVREDVDSALEMEQGGDSEPILLTTRRMPTEVDDIEYDPTDFPETLAVAEQIIEELAIASEFDEVTDVSSTSVLTDPESGEHRVTENVISQPDQGEIFTDEHHEVTAFMPAEAMAAMASQGVRAAPVVKKRKGKNAFPQELIPTRAYDDSASLIKSLQDDEPDDSGDSGDSGDSET